MKLVTALIAISLAGVQETAVNDRVMHAVRAAIAPALPFPETEPDGAVPIGGNTESLWMVRPLEPGALTIEVLANPLNEMNQLKAERAMAQIDNAIQSAQRRAEAQYERAVAEAKRTGRSQDVDGVTLADEGVAGAKIDAESRVLIEVAFNQLSYVHTFSSGRTPYPSTLIGGGTGASSVVVLPANTYRDHAGVERYAEGETVVYLGRVSQPVMKKRGDSDVHEVSATDSGANAGGSGLSSLVIRFRGNEQLTTDLLAKTRWDALLELLK